MKNSSCGRAEADLVNEEARISRALRFFLLFTIAAFLVNTAAYFREVRAIDALQISFLGAVYLSYSFIYLLPMLLAVLLWHWLLGREFTRRLLRSILVPRAAALFIPAALGFAAVQLFFFVDRSVFHLYGFHFNGFVYNLISTRGGIESLGGDDSTKLSFALIILGFVALQALAGMAAWKAAATRWRTERLLTRKRLVLGIIILVAIGLLERGTYAVSSIRGYTPVLAGSKIFPFYLPFTMRDFGRWLGLEPAKRESFQMEASSQRLHYPLTKICRNPEHPHYNVVWLVSESLRADMLDPEIMPASWAFAQKSTWLCHHYSGGNGTRMGLFSMFYGLYGPYWFSCLEEHRGPVLIDQLQQDGYQMQMYTSARFSYPEFDQTIFAKVACENLHEASQGFGWERDRENVTQLLSFIEHRDPARPFMTFMFFESPHAPYDFPPESVICEPYLDKLNYATMDPERDIQLIKNRYVNSCHHLDSQLERIVDALEANDLLQSTIVLITGDHGEEFLEHGRWGHNCGFSEEQLRVPCILWVPGRSPQEVTHMTSHLDIPVTLLNILGVANPSRDYSLGFDLFGTEHRAFTIISDWTNVVFVDEQFTAVFPLYSVEFGDQVTHTKGGAPVEDEGQFLEKESPTLVGVMKDLKRFRK